MAQFVCCFCAIPRLHPASSPGVMSFLLPYCSFLIQSMWMWCLFITQLFYMNDCYIFHIGRVDTENLNARSGSLIEIFHKKNWKSILWEKDVYNICNYWYICKNFKFRGKFEYLTKKQTNKQFFWLQSVAKYNTFLLQFVHVKRYKILCFVDGVIQILFLVF